MAKRKRRKSTTTKIVRIPSARAASPIIRVQAPRAPAVRHKRKSRRRSMIGGGGYTEPLGLAMGGLAFGFAVKQGWIQKLPEVPVIGRTGLAAILLHEAKKRNMGGEIVRRAATAAAVLTGYQLGLEGHVTGGEGESWPEESGYGGMYTGDGVDVDEADGDDDGATDFDDDHDLDDVEDQG